MERGTMERGQIQIRKRTRLTVTQATKARLLALPRCFGETEEARIRALLDLAEPMQALVKIALDSV